MEANQVQSGACRQRSQPLHELQLRLRQVRNADLASLRLAERPCDFEHGRVTQICSPADRDSQHFNEATSGANLTIAIKLLAVAMDAKRSITRVLVFKFSGHKPEQLTSDGRLGIVGRRKTENGRRQDSSKYAATDRVLPFLAGNIMTPGLWWTATGLAPWPPGRMKALHSPFRGLETISLWR